MEPAPRLSQRVGRPPLVRTVSEREPPFYPRESTSDERNEIVDVLDTSLFIGNWHAAVDHAALLKRGVTHILSVGSEFVDDVAPGGLLRFTKDIDDDPDQATSDSMGRSLCEMCEWIAQAVESGGRVLVHCAAGASRSPTVCLAYLISKQEARFPTLRAAFAYLYASRPCMWPNEYASVASNAVSIGAHRSPLTRGPGDGSSRAAHCPSQWLHECPHLARGHAEGRGVH